MVSLAKAGSGCLCMHTNLQKLNHLASKRRMSDSCCFIGSRHLWGVMLGLLFFFLENCVWNKKKKILVVVLHISNDKRPQRGTRKHSHLYWALCQQLKHVFHFFLFADSCCIILFGYFSLYLTKMMYTEHKLDVGWSSSGYWNTKRLFENFSCQNITSFNITSRSNNR